MLAPNKAEAAALDAAEEINDGFFDVDTEAEVVAIARQALAQSPLCADGYITLAAYGSRGQSETLFYWKAAVWAAELALGEAAFSELEGAFWGYLETRPYMRAKHGLAVNLWDAGRRDEAIVHVQHMLKLNPNDNQGVRSLLLDWYIRTGQDKKASALRKRYREDNSADMTWAEALLAFRNGGDTEAARRALDLALASNKHVRSYLSGQKKVPNKMPDSYSPGSVSEAVLYADQAIDSWRETPGAISWIVATPSQIGAAKT